MIGNNIAGTLSQIGLRAVQPATVIDNGKDMGKAIQDSLKMYNDYSKKQAYIDALQSGNQEDIDKALAAYDPQAYAKAMETRQAREWQLADADTQFARQKELANINFNNQVALADLKNKQAIGLKQLENALKSGQNDTESLANAQNAVNTLSRIAQNGNIGAMTRLRQGFGLANDQQERELGEISGAIAAIAPRAIAKLKAAGVSGVNTLGEFMTYVGLPQNATSKQIAGALPLIAQVAGVNLPEQQASPADIVTSMPTMSNLDVGATQKYNNGFSVTRIK